VYLALAVVVVSAGLVLWRWSAPGPLVEADTWWYARGALIYSGSTQADAEKQASVLICVGRHSAAAASNPACSSYHPISSPRYARIFTTRPLYPLLAAPLVGPLGGIAAALKAITMACCVAAGAFVYAGVRRSGGGRMAGFVALVALFVLPSGFWMTRLDAEAPMLVGLLGVTWGLLSWRNGRPSGLAWATAGLAWTFGAKSANGVAVAVALLVAAGLAVAFDERAGRRRNLGVGALGALGLLGWVVASAAFRLPGLGDTVQDLATRHFTTPDIANPWGYLLHNDLGLVRSQTLLVLRLGWPWLLTLAGLGTLIVQLRWRAIPWLAVGATGVLAVVAHPLRSEYQRLVIPLWLPVAAGIALLIGSGLRRLTRGSRAAADETLHL
jgi:hypothetical protein